MLKLSEIWTMAKNDQGNAVLLRPLDAPMVVPIFIGLLEAQSILIGMGNVPTPRPNTHDLLLNALGNAGFCLDKIEISDLDSDIFIANLVIKRLPGEEGPSGGFKEDARPSDALALAVRAKCPIYMAEKVITEAGVPLENFLNEREDLAKLNGIKITNLKQELIKAIQEENYEEAARIRDILLVLGKDSLDS
ncbi:MAG: bifunctional nuclease family protein [Spirochaetales bacterium]|jgi:bifunctional DNase/RNase|nr:bifunctional nuclease family protein [Spirochaetales bacterium]